MILFWKLGLQAISENSLFGHRTNEPFKGWGFSFPNICVHQQKLLENMYVLQQQNPPSKPDEIV